jgi:aspartyl-tRNA(Asn)/glutamyl-tRNA(Gln) amidotransferase subunit B
MPNERRARLVAALGLSEYDVNVLLGDKALIDYFEDALNRFSADKKKANAKPLVNWITTELLGRLNADKIGLAESKVTSSALAELVELIQSGAISGKIGKDVFADLYAAGGSAKEIVQRKGLAQVSDESALLKFIDEVIAENPKVVEDVRGGKERAVGSLVGALMKKTKGQANPQLANDLIKKRIGPAA